MTQTLTAMFASHAEAETARQVLVDQPRLDHPAARVSFSKGMSDTGCDAAMTDEDRSVLGSLKNLMVPQPGTAASRAVDNVLGTNIGGANPSRA